MRAKSWMGVEFYLIFLDTYWDDHAVLNYINKVSNINHSCGNILLEHEIEFDLFVFYLEFCNYVYG